MELPKKALQVKEKSEKKFGNKFTFIDLHLYVNNKEKISMVCPVHGVIKTTMGTHLRSKHGCYECGMSVSSNVEQGGTQVEKQKNLLLSISKIFGMDHYDVSKVVYVSNRTQVELSCGLHGTFYKTPEKLKDGQGCQECGKIGSSSWRRKIFNIDDLSAESNKIHGAGTYSFLENVVITSIDSIIPIFCNIHNETFNQSIRNHIYSKQGCKKCGIERATSLNRTNPTKILQNITRICHNKYTFDFDVEHIKNTYIDFNTKFDFLCLEHNQIFSKSYKGILKGYGCDRCSNSTSVGEKELVDFISSIYGGEIIENDKTTIKPHHIDILLPQLGIGFEYNGIYWHSNKRRSRQYHKHKSEKALDNGVRIIHIWEDDWLLQNEKTKKFIFNLVSNCKTKYFARNLSIKQPDKQEQMDFLLSNHFQGYSNNTLSLGLYDGDKLVQMMSVKCINKEKKLFEIGRLATVSGCSVVGGAQRLFKNLIKNIDFHEIISYNNLDKFTGGVYEKLGMDYVGWTRSYFFYKGIEKYSWMHIRKLGLGNEKSDNDIAEELGYVRVFTAGNSKYSYKNPLNNIEKAD